MSLSYVSCSAWNCVYLIDIIFVSTISCLSSRVYTDIKFTKAIKTESRKDRGSCLYCVSAYPHCLCDSWTMEMITLPCHIRNEI